MQAGLKIIEGHKIELPERGIPNPLFMQWHRAEMVRGSYLKKLFLASLNILNLLPHLFY
ncbi:MAG: hypothetical protein ACI9SK_002330 [Zhongshania sp.]|jgi:hypothetical protein